MTNHEVPSPPEQSLASAYSGTGDDVLRIVKPNSEGVLAAITGNDAREHFAVEGVDGNRELLVNTTDPYTGIVLLDAQGKETTQLQVTATGPWMIVLHPVDSAPRLSDTISGQGDGVVISEGVDRGRIAQIIGNREHDHFAVEAFSGQGSDLLVNTTDPYTGRVPFPGGVVVIAVTATGAWSITITDT